jgi:hypothetical protein
MLIKYVAQLNVSYGHISQFDLRALTCFFGHDIQKENLQKKIVLLDKMNINPEMSCFHEIAKKCKPQLYFLIGFPVKIREYIAFLATKNTSISLLQTLLNMLCIKKTKNTSLVGIHMNLSP